MKHQYFCDWTYIFRTTKKQHTQIPFLNCCASLPFPLPFFPESMFTGDLDCRMEREDILCNGNNLSRNIDERLDGAHPYSC